MAYDEGLAQIFRDDFADQDGISEKRMFGGLCFRLHGNMLCGVHKEGGMFRVGKENEPAALQIDGIDPLSFTGRPMGGMVDASADCIKDAVRRHKMIRLAMSFVGTLPAK